MQAGALRRGTGETIRAALLSADLRDFTALSEATEPAAMITALGAGFDRVAAAVHAFGGEVLKFIGNGVPAIFPVTGAPARACGAALHLGEILWGNIGAADRLDFTAIGPAVNLVSRLEGAVPAARPVGADLGRSRRRDHDAAGAAGRTRAARHRRPCAVFTLPDG